MLKVLGRRTSSNVMPVLWALDEMGVEYQQVDLGGPFGGNDQPEYLRKNPTGLVPTLEEDGFVLWESNAILRYVCSEHGLGSLCPVDARRRALAEQWMDWKQTTVMPMMGPIYMGLVRTPEKDRDLGRIQRATESGYKVWGILDRHLATHDFLLGSPLSMADLPLGPQIHRWFELVPDRPRMEHLEAWYERLQERPAFRARCMNEIV
jgi:glutathione S-transferase